MKQIAVVGSGVAGLTSAYYLSKDYCVDLYESADRIGGHTHTVNVPDKKLGSIPIDTGFIVFNEVNYPCFIKLLEELGVKYQNSDMSFSYENNQRPFFWGSDFPKGVFAQRKNLIKPSFYRFLLGIHHFNNRCLADFTSGLPLSMTLGEYLEHKGIHRDVVMDYVLPMTSAIWSASYEESLKFPILSFIRFWKNHQLLELGKGLQWKTVSGGSSRYIEKILPAISGQVFLKNSIQSIQRHASKIEIMVNGQSSFYDGVVIATHADTALRLLENPLPLEMNLLSRWTYSENKTILHTDSRFMPQKRDAWCSWNVRKPSQRTFDHPASVTYWMNRLQYIPSQTNYFVTLNPEHPVEPEFVIKEMTYTHPQMSAEAMGTQSTLPFLNKSSRIAFAGSYFGYGFHEDAVASAVQAVASIKKTLGECL